ncbi:MAG: hypothetical protein Q8K70_09535 [Bacteroidota bacterium]|nr:hypothetical protein [Bacteroidota bacterium]
MKAQTISSNIKQKKIYINQDTILIDSIKIIPGSVYIMKNNEWQVLSLEIKDNQYLIIQDSAMLFQTVELKYRVFSVSTEPVYQRKNPLLIEPEFLDKPRYLFDYNADKIKNDRIFSDGLNMSGNISRGLSVGNNQDVVLNSNLNLQMNGKLGKGFGILAAISDENNPIQPQGNTQQIQDFDKVFISIFKDSSVLTVGDFLMTTHPSQYFMKYYKKSRGMQLQHQAPFKFGKSITSIEGAVSRGRFSRNEIQGVEGNQGPYRLNGANNEFNIIIISGTEVVYIDGQKMERGQQNDYVIDYNTGEITFMPRRLINKFMRIVVEFQYSDRNYSRSVFAISQQFTSKKWTSTVNYYTEQDNKLQPTDTSNFNSIQTILENAGDNKALYQTNKPFKIFQKDRVNYILKDSLGYDFYQFTNNPLADTVFYTLGFSYVGAGNGNYILASSSANGRVFSWVFPVNNIPSGDYEPYVELVAPKRQQMLSASTQFRKSENSVFAIEGAYTNNNVNTLSSLDKFNDDGFGIFISSSQKNMPWRKFIFNHQSKFEFVNKNFSFIERYRAVEFNRIWNRQISNIGNVVQNKHELIGDVNAKIEYNKKHHFNMNLSSFKRFDLFDGYRIQGGYQLLTEKVQFKIRNENLTSTEQRDSIKIGNRIQNYQTELSYQFEKITLGFQAIFEESIFSSDTSLNFQQNSFRYEEVGFNLKTKGEKKWNYQFESKLRTDYSPSVKQFDFLSRGINYNLNIEHISPKMNRLNIVNTYRYLVQKDVDNDPQTILGRIEYSSSYFKKVLISHTFYQVGTGREQRRQFSYLPVLTGTGTHSWIDYNENGLEEIDEFEIAVFKDQANYVKVFLPTNEFIKSNNNEFNQTFRIQAPNNWNGANKFKSFVSKFNTITSYKAERKITDNSLLTIINPLKLNLVDTSLIVVSSLIKQTTFFNRSNSKFGMEHNIQTNRGKQFLNNGFESRQQDKQSLSVRFGFAKNFSLVTNIEQSRKENINEFFENRSYNYESQIFNPELFYQSAIGLRLGTFYKYTQAINKPQFSNDRGYIHEIGAEGRYFIVNKGNFDVRVSRFFINYIGNLNSPLAFDVLNGLTNGNNMTWRASFGGKAKNNIQMNISYEGRQNNENPIVHIGRVEARYIF